MTRCRSQLEFLNPELKGPFDRKLSTYLKERASVLDQRYGQLKDDTAKKIIPSNAKPEVLAYSDKKSNSLSTFLPQFKTIT